jgi:hypothetical protein
MKISMEFPEKKLKIRGLVTWEAEIGNITVNGHPGKKFMRLHLNQ